MVRQGMPFTRGSKLSDENYNPERWKKQPGGQLGSYALEESAGATSAALDKSIVDEVKNLTTKEFVAKYGQENYNTATNLMQEAGYGSVVRDRIGNTVSFKLRQSQGTGTGITSKAVRQERINFIKKLDTTLQQSLAAKNTPKEIPTTDFPPELQRATRGMGFESTGQLYTEKYIPGVTDAKTASGELKDTSVFFEGEQLKTTQQLRDDIKVLEDVINDMNKSDTYDKPITEMGEIDSARINRINKARLREGLEPIVKSRPLVNLEIKEKTLGDFYYNQLLSKQVELSALEETLGKSKEQLELFNRIDKLPAGTVSRPADMSISEMELTTERVTQPLKSKQNPTENVRIAEDIVSGVVNRTTYGGKPSTALSAFKGRAFNELDVDSQAKILDNASFKKLVSEYKKGFATLGEVDADKLAKEAAIVDVDNILLERDTLGWNIKKTKGFNTKATIKNLVEDLQKTGAVDTSIRFRDVGIPESRYLEYEKLVNEGKLSWNPNYKEPDIPRVQTTRKQDYDMSGKIKHSSSSRTVWELPTTGLEPQGYSVLNTQQVLSGETVEQAKVRNVVLAEIAGWDAKESTWMKNSDVAKYEKSQKDLRKMVDAGLIDPMNIAWREIQSDFKAGTFNADNISKYIKPSAVGKTDTANFKQVLGKTSSTTKSSGLPFPGTVSRDGRMAIGKEDYTYVEAEDYKTPTIPEAKRAVEIAPSSVDLPENFNIKSLTDQQIMKLPAYEDALKSIGSLENVSDAAKSKIAITRTRNALEVLSKQGPLPKGFLRMLKNITKGL